MLVRSELASNIQECAFPTKNNPSRKYKFLGYVPSQKMGRGSLSLKNPGLKDDDFILILLPDFISVFHFLGEII